MVKIASLTKLATMDMYMAMVLALHGTEKVWRVFRARNNFGIWMLHKAPHLHTIRQVHYGDGFKVGSGLSILS